MKRFFIVVMCCAALLGGVAAKSKRSSEWRRIRSQTVASFPYCAVCGCERTLEPHHIKPFAYHPELELDTNNLVVLCRQKGSGCHFWVGHGGISWQYENTNIEEILQFDTGKKLYEARLLHRESLRKD